MWNKIKMSDSVKLKKKNIGLQRRSSTFNDEIKFIFILTMKYLIYFEIPT